jgi:hypothetical protein
MKKIISIFAVVFLIISGLGTIGTSINETESVFKTTSTDISFSRLSLKQTDANYTELELEDVSTFLMEPGKPVLPKVVKTFELPFGAKNVNVDVTISEIFEKYTTKEVRPSLQMLPLTNVEKPVNLQIKDLEIYSSDEPYPSSWYSYSLHSGLNKDNKRVTFVVVHLYPVRYIPNAGKILQAESSNIKVTYELSQDTLKTSTVSYDLVIIAPSLFEPYLEKLVNHKNDIGVKTFLKTTEEIYADSKYDGVDKSEDIKLFIKDAIETYDITYVLLVGGLKNQFLARPKDDANQGVKGWYLPVRYTNLYDQPKFPLKSDDDIFDPGVISDLYFADIYDGEGNFSSWDPNNDGVFAAWGKKGVEDDEDIDMVPDVCVGRLACRNIKEVKTVVDKIITYETTEIADSDWFNTMTVISGDGFLDQEDWDIQWDTTGLKNGYYTIYAQSFNKEDEESLVETIQIKIDREQKTFLTFKHNDYLNPDLGSGYPAPPIVEIVTVSPGDILGYDDFTYTPGEGEAYCNNFNPWANISYVNGVLTIRGKSYDPKPYGNLTDIHVWIKDKNGDVIFSDWRYDLDMYYEGEWTTGEKAIYGRGGALYYMDGFEKDILWSSNGRYSNQMDILNALNKGSGFVFMSGHGSPNSWGDHYPGVPGNRQHGSTGSLTVTNIRPWPPFISYPLYPIDSLKNGEKLPVTVIGGCHNSQFNVSMVLGVLDLLAYYFPQAKELYMWCHGVPVPECMGWRFVRSPNGGSIATIGNTGLGYGMPGKDLTTGGGDGWITIEFFRQYGEEGQTVLGNAHTQAITTYIQTHDMNDFEAGHPKTVQQWVLLGDPSLQIGGYK